VKYLTVAALTLCTLALSLSLAVAQGIYKWTDARGQVHFSNAPTGTATAVDEDLPPAANFGDTGEPLPPAEAPIAAAPQAQTPVPPVTAVPPGEETPTATQPLAEEQPNDTTGEPTAAAEEPSQAPAEATAEMVEQPQAAPDTTSDEENADVEESEETGEADEDTLASP
jgi:hypothetical protein